MAVIKFVHVVMTIAGAAGLVGSAGDVSGEGLPGWASSLGGHRIGGLAPAEIGQLCSLPFSNGTGKNVCSYC